MPITKTSEAKEGGFAQARESLIAFEGDVVEQDARGNKTEFGQWNPTIDEATGKARPPKEYFQVVCVNVKPIETTEELPVDISEGWSFRVNCSDYKGQFWVDAFLKSAEDNKIIIPEGLIGKRILFRKKTLEAVDKKGNHNPKFDTSNFVIEKVIDKAAPEAKPAKAANATEDDLLNIVLDMADGCTESALKTSIGLHPAFANSPLLPLAKSGALTQTLIDKGKLKQVNENGKLVYRKVA